ncbi:MAG TPA: phosphate starvation-inducible protein PhoH [Fibrobacteres bacterium]|jgi:PhoH-like ATPase|nr:phosphate starvation-inducible protein PhoH [Fibrobacterota bacterium]
MKNYILDTTVLLYDPQALFKFEENNVFIPITVIEDIDRFKKDLNETGRNARQTSRHLDGLRLKGSLTSGVKIDMGGKVIVKLDASSAAAKIPREFQSNPRDNLILSIALDVKEKSGGVPTFFVSKDINLRIKADALGLDVEDYESDKVDIEELYSGFTAITVMPEAISGFFETGAIAYQGEEKLFVNQYVTIADASDASRIAYGRYQRDGKIVKLAREDKDGVWRIKPRNKEQIFSMDALLNDSIQLVTLVGKAGTGKTLLAVAASLYKTVDENVYNHVLVSRPTLPMGKDIGFLPGTIEEKLAPWMYPIADNVDLLMRSEAKARRHIRGFKELLESGILIVEPLTYIRGRSIHNQFLIIDEAQNLTPHEIKTIITRVGDGSKIILTGDPYQIDNPYIDSSSNGLTYVVERFKDQEVAAHITFTKGERSVLSELAANLL